MLLGQTFVRKQPVCKIIYSSFCFDCDTEFKKGIHYIFLFPNDMRRKMLTQSAEFVIGVVNISEKQTREL